MSTIFDDKTVKIVKGSISYNEDQVLLTGKQQNKLYWFDAGESASNVRSKRPNPQVTAPAPSLPS